MATTTEDDALAAVIRRVSPAAIAEAMQDPAVFEMVARGDLYVELGRLRQLAANPNLAVSHRLEYAKFLSKMGKVEKPEGDSNPFTHLPQINIVLPGSGQTTTIGKVVEHE